MTLEADIADAISRQPVEANDALVALQWGAPAPITLDSLAAVAQMKGQTLAQTTLDLLKGRHLLDAYAVVLGGRGVVLGPPRDEQGGDEATMPTGPARRFQPEGLQRFLPIGQAARCRIIVGEPGQLMGSGSLVSPSLVLTAWHVIAPEQPQSPDPSSSPPISVQLADGTRRSVSRVFRYQSPCSLPELQSRFPRTDADYDGHNDIVLLELTRPDGARLNFIGLPPICEPPQANAQIFVLDFPEGRNEGWAGGIVRKIRGLSARMRHDAPTAEGSSGAACIDTQMRLMGVHQGKWPPHKRLVPLTRFHADIIALVAADRGPALLWSLDGTLDTPLVFGRDLFFEAIASASKVDSRVRGVRVRRIDLSAGASGLAFSAQLLERLLERNPTTHQSIRLAFDPPGQDLLEDIRTRACAKGYSVAAIAPAAGVRPGDTTPEAAINDQARLLAAALNAAVEAAGSETLLWLFFENPVGGLSDPERYGLEAIVGAALKQPRLRLVLAGFETISLPGASFADAAPQDGLSEPGLVNERIGRFGLPEVEALIQRASKALDLDLGAGVAADMAWQALEGLTQINGAFGLTSLQDASIVNERLTASLKARLLRADREGAPAEAPS